MRADELSEAEGLQALPAPLHLLMDTPHMIARLPRRNGDRDRGRARVGQS